MAANTTQMRDALALATEDHEKAKDPSKNPIVWLCEAMEGDFNENRSTSQILTDAAISMIPLIDQICDIRDLIADSKKIIRDHTDKWAWVALVLTLIGLSPTLGSLVKGVLKVFFAFVRRAGITEVGKTVEAAMSWLIKFLRRKEVQQYLKLHRVDFIFQWLADEIKLIRARIDTKSLLAVFDEGISVLETLANEVRLIPAVYHKAKSALEQVKHVRGAANEHIGQALQPVHDILNTIILRLEHGALAKQRGILNTTNIHFRGAIPETHAVAIMRKRKPLWLSKNGDNFIRPCELDRYRSEVNELSAKVDSAGNPYPPEEVFPPLSDQSIISFHTMEAHTIKGPARLYRIISPGSRGMSECWISEEVFHKLQNSPNPKEAWRRFLAVWPDWNGNGQFVTFDIKAGKSLNVWRGPAASQVKDALPGNFLEGGWDQIVFNVERGSAHNDTIVYYKVKNGKNENRLGPTLTQAEVDKLTANMNKQQKVAFFEDHLAMRQQINHPDINGPFETGWGYTDFEDAILANKIGVPTLPGQLTKIAN
jgi:hypothetical protein